MSDNVGSAHWTKLTEQRGLAFLNHTMLLTYQV